MTTCASQPTASHRRRIALTLIVVGALAGAGCGSGGSSPPSGGGTAAGRSDADASAREQGVKFAECVRGHGVADFPDPDADGEFEYGVSVSAEVWRSAVEACKSLQPAGSLSTDRTPEEQSAGLRFAKCVREHGVKDFPDPIEGEPLINTYRIPSANADGGMAILNAAIEQCRGFGPGDEER